MAVSTASDDSFKKAEKWLGNCLRSHEKCGPGDDVALPKRLISVEGDKIRLVETSPEEKSRYVCLSYRWGDDMNFTTTTYTRALRMEGIQWDELPATLRDAIFITRKLGIPYIWIDALCILQDDTNDWDEQSAQMVFIYQNAYLTICAESSNGAHAGIFSEAAWPDCFLGHFEGLRFFVRVDPHQWMGNSRAPEAFNPLETRAWTYQEFLLSRRCLHFGAQEIHWSCRESNHLTEPLCECETPERGRDTGYSKVAGTHISFYDDGQNIANEWYRVLQNYTRRKLTYDTDKLPALSGIAKYCLARRDSDDQYLAGLWRKSLVEDLCWFHHTEVQYGFPGTAAYARRPESYCAPTWSWASVVSTTSCKTWSDEKNTIPFDELVNTFCNIHDASCVLKGLDPTGRVSGGVIDISGPILEGTLEPGRYKTSDRYGIWLHDGFYEGSFAPDCLNDTSIPYGTVLSCLVLMETVSTHSSSLGLLALRRCPEWTEARPVYSRLGFTIIIKPNPHNDDVHPDLPDTNDPKVLKEMEDYTFQWDKANNTRILLV
ncbi:uncharacterized protein CTRU02_203846 [Colletotrichum truncatum]|uniref:Uncharacterized protein n=1 Tax=Colletotrichum truncatum TaxID=5467 RepID=A0ACC3ZAB5_COLTU|nr:uncharacterized protein CTRU02_04179 [Colletotrichum truncatum]KAF6796218.1 hypothetical protein CTRU02_04179 [Colletotrichum truncatum]